MTKTFNAQAAVLAVVATLATLSGAYSIAAYEHQAAVVAVTKLPSVRLARAVVPVERVVVVGRRARG